MSSPSSTPAGEPVEEWFTARCTADGCDRQWEAHGTRASRAAAARAQKHADRSGHRIDAQWANRR